MGAGETFFDGRVTLYAGDCLAVLADLPAESVDAVVTDPPYHLQSIVDRFGEPDAAPAQGGVFARSARGFMGQTWDGGDVAFDPATWRAVTRVLKPGGFLVAFSGTRTYHRMACAIEDAGFDVRDMLQWLYGTGFPKSHNVSLSIDKAAGAPDRSKSFNMKGGGERSDEFATNGREFPPPYEPTTPAGRQWDGWGTALKPACEPICLARKPLSEATVAGNVLRFGTGALNIDGCRVPLTADAIERQGPFNRGPRDPGDGFGMNKGGGDTPLYYSPAGRWPANVVHDGSGEVVAMFPAQAGGNTGARFNNAGDLYGMENDPAGYDDSGSAARFFYCAKADEDDRLGSRHPTVKPVDLLRWLVRLVTPPGGTVLDPFAGTGTTGEAAWREGCRAVLMERETEYCGDIRRRMALALAGPLARTAAKARRKPVADLGPLFKGLETDGEAGP